MDERLRHRRPVLQSSHAVWRIDEYTCDFLFTALTTSTDINIRCALPVQFFYQIPSKVKIQTSHLLSVSNGLIRWWKHANTQLQILLPWKCLDRNQLQLWLMLNLSPSFIYMEMTQTVTVGKAADAQTVIMLKRLVAVGAMHHRPIEAE